MLGSACNIAPGEAYLSWLAEVWDLQVGIKRVEHKVEPPSAIPNTFHFLFSIVIVVSPLHGIDQLSPGCLIRMKFPWPLRLGLIIAHCKKVIFRGEDPSTKYKSLLSVFKKFQNSSIYNNQLPIYFYVIVINKCSIREAFKKEIRW